MRFGTLEQRVKAVNFDVCGRSLKLIGYQFNIATSIGRPQKNDVSLIIPTNMSTNVENSDRPIQWICQFLPLCPKIPICYLIISEVTWLVFVKFKQNVAKILPRNILKIRTAIFYSVSERKLFGMKVVSPILPKIGYMATSLEESEKRFRSIIYEQIPTTWWKKIAKIRRA